MDTLPSESTPPDGETRARAKKQEVLDHARADLAVKGQPTSGVDSAGDTPAADAVPQPHGATNQTR